MHNIVIITNKPFPEGYASTIRFISYSQGLIEAGYRVYVHCINPTEAKNNIRNHLTEGQYKKIDFKYTSGRTIKSCNIVIRFLTKFYGLINSLITIRKLNKRSKIKAIILIGPFGIFKELSYYFLSRFSRIRLIQERTEFPYITPKFNLVFKINLWLYLKISCKLYDAMIVISDVLSEYFKAYLSRRAQILIIPIIVDPDRFEGISPNSNAPAYIAYCGSMHTNKDGVDVLLEAFNMISSKFPSLNLKLIGNTDFTGFSLMVNKVSRLEFNDRIKFTGWVSNEEMERLLKQAKLLALARPSTEQAKANFPTKIGEYLATGKPIVTTTVGVIPKYLHHGVNAYLAEPDNVADFAEKMGYVLENYADALKVGAEGKKLAYSEFNHLYQGRQLAEFIETI